MAELELQGILGGKSTATGNVWTSRLLNFSHVNVKEILIQELRTQFLAGGLKEIKVVKSDPLSSAEIPCVCINRVSDDEANQVIGGDFGEVYLVDDDTGEESEVDAIGTYFNETLEIRLWHKNADERDRVYYILKAILLASRPNLELAGLRNISLRGGRDEQDNQMLAPNPLYWAVLMMNYLSPLIVSRTDMEGVDSIEAHMLPISDDDENPEE